MPTCIVLVSIAVTSAPEQTNSSFERIRRILDCRASVIVDQGDTISAVNRGHRLCTAHVYGMGKQ